MNMSTLGRSGDAYLRLQVAPDCEAAISMYQAEEAVIIPSIRLSLIPNANPALMGVLNHRNRVFWVLDLPYLLGFSPLPSSLPEYSVALLRVNGNPLAWAVQRIRGVMRAEAEALRSPLNLDSPNLVPYLQGCFYDGEQPILVLDVAAIFRQIEPQ